MSFGDLYFLYGAALLPAVLALFVWAARRRQSALASLGDPALIRLLADTVHRPGRRLRAALWIAALALILFALARPQWGSSVTTIERQGLQVIFALDVSASMLAEDVRPNRLERAKLETADMMGRLAGDEVGLVLFAGAAFLQLPLTFDYGTARVFLDGAEPDAVSRRGTAIAEAIDAAIAGFDAKRSSQKVIVLMTDGESHEGDTSAAARRAAEQGVVVYTIGIGSPDGDPVPRYDESGRVVGYKRDSAGETVLSKLDEETLRQIARETGGSYYRATAVGSAVAELAAEMEDLQRASLQSEEETRGIERFQVFLLLALAALAFAELMPDRVGAPLLPWRLPLPRRLQLGSRRSAEEAA